MKAFRKKALQAFLRAIHKGRAGSADELSRLIVFLASWRSSYITGQVINCDGGWIMQ